MKPPFSITNQMLNKVVDISQMTGQLEFQLERNLKLRKVNRIKAIHSSLAIENNHLTLEQITAILDGKRVLGNPREIQEVKNAFDAYDEVLSLNPYDQKDFLYAHSLLTQGLVNHSGEYRNSDVGIFDGQGNVVHMGARPQFLVNLMNDLFAWGKTDDTPELIKSCVFHYEIETIHPFEDGNGRMGRMWQTVILANWNPLFSWIPVETLIQENQEAYYEALAQSDHANDSTFFIEFMLSIIYNTLIAYKENQIMSDNATDKLSDKLTKKEKTAYMLVKKYLETHDYITTTIASKLVNISPQTMRRYLTKFTELGLMEAQGHNKNRTYRLRQN